MRKPMALVLNKTQKLDVGTLVIEKVHLHLSVYLALELLSDTEHRDGVTLITVRNSCNKVSF